MAKTENQPDQMTMGMIEMSEIRRCAAAIGVGVLCALALSGPALASERVATPEPSDSMVPGSTQPESPETTEPEDTTPEDSTPDDTLVGAGDPDGDIDTTVAVVAVIGFLLLLAVASWWMVRRSDPDGQPMPPQSGGAAPSDLI